MTSAPKPLRTVEGIEEYQLENGLRVLLLADLTQPTITVNITYLVGSRHEGRGESGMAHLLEHMLFKGCPRHPSIKASLQDKGCIFNATTWLDRTNYYETLPATEANLRFMLDLESDRMVNSWIKQSDLDAEMTVVRNEFEMGENDPFHVLHDQMMSAAYRWHNYGKSTIGNRSDIERVPADALRPFYKKYYQPDNAVLMVAGQIDRLQTLDLIGEYFGPIPRPARKLDQTYTEEPVQDGPRVVNLQRVGEVAFLGTAYHVPSAAHEEYAAIKVICEMLGSEPSGKLYKKLVETGLAAEVFAMPYALAEPGMVLFFAKPKENGKAQDLLSELINEVEHIDVESLTEKDLVRSKSRLLKNIKLSMTNSKDFAMRLTESIAQGDYTLYFIHRDRIKNVTLENVKYVLKKYFIESNRTSGVFTPTESPKRAKIETVNNLSELTQNYKSDSVSDSGEVFEASTSNIEEKVERSKGLNISSALLAKPTRLSANVLRLIFRIGDESSLVDQYINMRLLADMLQRGSKNKSYADVQDEFDQLESSFSVYNARGAMVASLTSDKNNIMAAIPLIGELLKEPAFSEEEFQIVVDKELSELQEVKSDPQQLAMNAVARAKSPWPVDSIHYVPTIDEQISALKTVQLQDITELYGNIFGAQHLDYACVGDFDKEKLEQTISAEFAEFNTNAPYKRIMSPFREVLPKNQTLITPDKEMAFVTMATNLPMSDQAAEYPALRLANYIFGESMKSRMMMRIREKEGLAYGCGSYVDMESLDENGSITLYSMTAPQNAHKTLKIMQEELNKWIDKGLTQKELDEAYASFETYFNNMLANDGYLVKTLSSNLELDRKMGYYVNLLERMKSLTESEINQVIQNVFKDAKWSVISAGDLEKKTKKLKLPSEVAVD